MISNMDTQTPSTMLRMSPEFTRETSANAYVSLQKPPVDSLLDKYIKSLTDKEYQGYMIAKSHLGSSFDLEKSTGFREWKQNNAPK